MIVNYSLLCPSTVMWQRDTPTYLEITIMTDTINKTPAVSDSIIFWSILSPIFTRALYTTSPTLAKSQQEVVCRFLHNLTIFFRSTCVTDHFSFTICGYFSFHIQINGNFPNFQILLLHHYHWSFSKCVSRLLSVGGDSNVTCAMKSPSVYLGCNPQILL